MGIVEEAEPDRAEFAKEGNDLDRFLAASIEEGIDAVLGTIRAGHGVEFALLYGCELYVEDHERAIFNAYCHHPMIDFRKAPELTHYSRQYFICHLAMPLRF
jgi:hypothetical protein